MSLFAAGLKRQLKKEVRFVLKSRFCGRLTLVCMLGTPQQNAFVGIYAKNRAEWCIADLACICRGYPTVPLPSTLGANKPTGLS
jgi:acyl-CoA synthetase (AMP-forming)/AMP-acid ligase II